MRSCTPPHMCTGKKIIQNTVKLGIRVTSRIGRGCKASGRGSQAPADLKMKLLAWSTWLTSEAFSVWALTLPSSLREPHHLSSRVASKKECKQTSYWFTLGHSDRTGYLGFHPSGSVPFAGVMRDFEMFGSHSPVRQPASVLRKWFCQVPEDL